MQKSRFAGCTIKKNQVQNLDGGEPHLEYWGICAELWTLDFQNQSMSARYPEYDTYLHILYLIHLHGLTTALQRHWANEDLVQVLLRCRCTRHSGNSSSPLPTDASTPHVPKSGWPTGEAQSNLKASTAETSPRTQHPPLKRAIGRQGGRRRRHALRPSSTNHGRRKGHQHDETAWASSAPDTWADRIRWCGTRGYEPL